MSISTQRESLKAIGIQLYNAFVADKLIQAMGEAGKISIKQALGNLCGLHIEDSSIAPQSFLTAST